MCIYIKNVIFSVTIIQTLQNLRCVEGVSLTLECLLTGPEYKAKWYKNGRDILFDKEVTRAHLCYHVNDTNFQAHKLIFSKITQAERGAYILQVGKERCECFLDITGWFVIYFLFSIVYILFTLIKFE